MRFFLGLESISCGATMKTIAEIVERLNSLDVKRAAGEFESDRQKWDAAVLEASAVESLHREADNLLCEALTLLGRGDVAEAYVAARGRVGFWFA